MHIFTRHREFLFTKSSGFHQTTLGTQNPSLYRVTEKTCRWEISIQREFHALLRPFQLSCLSAGGDVQVTLSITGGSEKNAKPINGKNCHVSESLWVLLTRPLGGRKTQKLELFFHEKEFGVHKRQTVLWPLPFLREFCVQDAPKICFYSQSLEIFLFSSLGALKINYWGTALGPNNNNELEETH
jgi:hypothetical protein